MHMADALVVPIVAGTMYTCSTIAAGYSTKKLRLEDDPKKIPVMGVMGAFVFATQMINFTIPGTGSSGHLCGGILLTALLGPYAAFLAMIGVLLIQCLMFADGGLLALGCNIWNMGFYGCFIGGLLIWNPIMKKGFSKKKIIIASILGSIITLQLGSLSVSIQTLASGITVLPFSSFVLFMQPIHLAIGFIEGLIISAVLCFIYEARPELLWSKRKEVEHKEGKMTLKKVIAIISIVTVLIGGGFSLFASEYPDGLEWSIEKLTSSTDIEKDLEVYDKFENAQSVTAILPDYSFKESDSYIGTSVSGVVGSLIVVGVCVSGCYIFNIFKKRSIT